MPEPERGMQRTGREKPACEVFLLTGDILAFWVGKTIVLEPCLQLLTALQNSVAGDDLKISLDREIVIMGLQVSVSFY